MVDFSFISARFLGADDADKAFASPREHHSVHVCIDPAECNEANFPVVFAVVDPLQNLVRENLGGCQERDAVFSEIGFGFLFVPLEFQFHESHHPN